MNALHHLVDGGFGACEGKAFMGVSRLSADFHSALWGS